MSVEIEIISKRIEVDKEQLESFLEFLGLDKNLYELYVLNPSVKSLKLIREIQEDINKCREVNKNLKSLIFKPIEERYYKDDLVY